MSCLISGKQDYLNFLQQNECYLSDFGMSEISRYQHIIRAKTKLPPEEFDDFAIKVFAKLTVVPNLLVSNSFHYQAFVLCRDIDEDDTVYLAFSLALNHPLLTRDKPLADGLRAKGYTNVVLLDELFE